MIIPPWVYAAGAGITLLAGVGAGWTLRDWKADSDALAAIEKAQKEERRLRDQLLEQAVHYEGEKADAQQQSQGRQEAIRVVYRDRPVSADCAVPADARSVLNDAILDANARAAGEPPPTMPRPSRSAKPDDRP